MVKMRPAITLFITLAVIVAMLALVGIIFSYLSEARIKAEDKSALIESNLIYADVSNAVRRFVGKKPSTGTLKNVYNIPITIQEEKGPFSLLAACTPARAAVPITWFKTTGGAKTESRLSLAEQVLENIGLKYRLKNTEKLKTLLSNALDNKYETEFGKESRLKRKVNYFSYTEFQKVLTQYFLSENDKNVYKINWKNYFAFGEGFKSIDGNFLSSSLVAMIFGIDERIVEEEFKSGELKKFLIDNGADMEVYNSDIFAKTPVVAMTCRATYSFGKGSYSLKFKYIDGKVEGFEFNQ